MNFSNESRYFVSSFFVRHFHTSLKASHSVSTTELFPQRSLFSWQRNTHCVLDVALSANSFDGVLGLQRHFFKSISLLFILKPISFLFFLIAKKTMFLLKNWRFRGCFGSINIVQLPLVAEQCAFKLARDS